MPHAVQLLYCKSVRHRLPGSVRAAQPAAPGSNLGTADVFTVKISSEVFQECCVDCGTQEDIKI